MIYGYMGRLSFDDSVLKLFLVPSVATELDFKTKGQ